MLSVSLIHILGNTESRRMVVNCLVHDNVLTAGNGMAGNLQLGLSHKLVVCCAAPVARRRLLPELQLQRTACTIMIFRMCKRARERIALARNEVGAARERQRLLAVVGLGNLALHRNTRCAPISTVNKYSGMFEKILDLYRLWRSQGHVATEMNLPTTAHS